MLENSKLGKMSHKGNNLAHLTFEYLFTKKKSTNPFAAWQR